MSPRLNSRNSLQNPEHLNLPSRTLTTRLRGTHLPLGPVLLTCPLAASPPHYVRIPKALPQHPALLPALLLQPHTRLPSALPHLRCPRGQKSRTREERDNPHRITQSLLSLVSNSIYMQTKTYTREAVFQLPLMYCVHWLKGEIWYF